MQNTTSSDLFMEELTKRVNKYFSEKHITRFADIEMKLKIIIYLFLQVLLYICMLNSSDTFSFIILYLLTGLVTILSAINIAHDAAHHVIFANHKYNNILYWVTFQLSGYNPDVWKFNHVSGHHTNPNIQEKDPHFPETPFFRFADWQQWKPYHKYQHLYAVILYSIHSVVYFFVEEPRIFSGSHPHIKLSKTDLVKGLTGKMFYLTLFIIFPWVFTGFPILLILLVFLGKHVIISVIMTLVLGINHFTKTTKIFSKEDKSEKRWSSLQLESTIDFATEKRWVYWLVGGFNAHALHHLFPGICHVHYRRLVPIFRQTIKKYNIPYQEESFFRVLKMHFEYLKYMGQGYGKN